MARKTVLEVTCDVCGADNPDFRLKVSDTDPEEGGPVVEADICTTCAADMVKPIKDRDLVRSLRLR